LNPIIVGIYYECPYRRVGDQVYIPGAWTLKQLLTDPKSLFDRSPKNPDGSRIFIDESELLEMFLKEPIDIWVNSFGGARSNFIVNLLEQKYVIQNEAHRAKGCHYIRPLEVDVDMGVFCFVDDFGLALSSQINRGFTFNYNKLREDAGEFSVERWIENVSMQIDNWTSGSFFPVVLINTDHIEENASEFERTFGVPFSGFQKRKTREMNPNLEQFYEQIAEVNEKLAELPNFTILGVD
jgi:hypothetical protein